MSRYDDMSEKARFYLENWDEIDLAEMLARSDVKTAELEARLSRLRDLAEASRHAGARGITWEALDALLDQPIGEIVALSDTVISHSQEALDV